jgi:hypothetical protein
MTSPLPTSVPTDGTTRFDYVPAIASPGAPTVAELTAGTVKSLDAYITGDGWNATGDQATVTDNRIATKQTFEQPGRKTRSLSITYVHNQASPTNDVAAVTLAEGVTGYVVARFAVPRGTAYAAGQRVQVWPITAGEAMENYNGENSVHTMTQKLFVTNEVKMRALVVA